MKPCSDPFARPSYRTITEPSAGEGAINTYTLRGLVNAIAAEERQQNKNQISHPRGRQEYVPGPELLGEEVL